MDESFELMKPGSYKLLFYVRKCLILQLDRDLYACLICKFDYGLTLSNATMVASYLLTWFGILKTIVWCWICYDFLHDNRTSETLPCD